MLLLFPLKTDGRGRSYFVRGGDKMNGDFISGLSNPRLGADVVLEFQKSIENIQQFGQVMEQLDSRFGSIERRVDALRSSLSSLTAQTNRGYGNTLRRNIENEINNIVAANGLVLTSVGTAPFRVREETVRNIFRRIDAELNRAVARSIGEINIALDPNFMQGRFVLGKSEFDALNREVARLVRTQISAMVTALRREGAGVISPENLAGLQLDIGRQTVKDIMLSVKRQLLPYIINPELPTEGISLTFTRQDMNRLSANLKARLMETINVQIPDLPRDEERRQQMERQLVDLRGRVDSIVDNYVRNISRGIASIDTTGMEVPVQNLSQSLRRFIARDLGITLDRFNKMFESISMSEMAQYELRRQFEALQRMINNKFRTGTAKMVADLNRAIRQIEIEPSQSLQYHLISEINKINTMIIHKIREQVDKQFASLRAEIAAINTTPRTLRRSTRIAQMSRDVERIDGVPYVVHTPSSSISTSDVRQKFGQDRYARRDAHFAQFGLEGAVINTFRHILAGSMVGAPIMAMYQALESFRASQLEQLKIMQNFMLKEEFQREDGEINFAGVQREIDRLIPMIKEMSLLYAVQYSDMSKVAGIASRLTSSVEETRQFMDYATAIQRMDSEGDLVETIAPGLEAIMGQFNKTVWQMDEAVRAFAVATNRTKTTTDELMNAMMRSSSSLAQAGMSITDAAIFNAIAVQLTGLSGENIGNMAKTIMTRLTLPTTQSILKDYGIETYTTDERGRVVRRDAVEILTEIANMVKLRRMGEDELDRIFYASAGGYQISKFLAFISSFNDLNIEDTGLNFHRLREQAVSMTDEQVDEILSRTLTTTVHNMNRAQVSVTLALTSILEEMRPQIDSLMSNIVNLSEMIRENSDTIAELIGVMANVAIGYAAMAGVRRLGRSTGFNEIDARNVAFERMVGTRGAVTGKVTEGTLSPILPLLSREVADQLQDRRFFHRAMQNPELAPYLTELSRMDELRQRELSAYLQANRPENLAQLFMAMDESRGRGVPRERMTARDVQERAQTNVNRLLSSATFANVLSRDIGRELSRIMENREDFLRFNSTLENRRFTRTLARMDEDKIRGFEQSISRMGVGSITSLNQLTEIMGDYNRSQERAARLAQTTETRIKTLNEAIKESSREINANTKTWDNFLGFLDSVPRRAQSAATALMNLGRTIARFAWQFAVFYAIGDVISTVTEQSLKTEEEKELDRRKRAIDAYSEGMYLDRSGIGGMLSFLRHAWGSVKNIGDWLLGGSGDVALGLPEVMRAQNEFLTWMTENYGSRAAQELRKNREYMGRSVDDFIQEFLETTDLYDEVLRAERELFRARAEKAREEYEQVQKYKEDAERAQQLAEQAYLERGEFTYFSLKSLRENIQELIETQQEVLQVKELEHLLEGYKTYSREVYNIQRERLEIEYSIMEEQIKRYEEFIQAQEDYLRELESTGQHMTTNEEGELVETAQYRDLQLTLDQERAKLETLRQEYSTRMMEIELELNEMYLREALEQAEIAISDAQTRKQLLDSLGGLSMDRSSTDYIDYQISTTTEMVRALRDTLEELKAQDLLDPSDELKQRIQSLELTILGAEMTLKDLAIQRISGYRHDLQLFDAEQEVELLRRQVALGGADDHPALRQLRISQGQERISELSRIMEDLRIEMRRTTDPEIRDRYQRELLELEKQSLRVQLGILEEVRNQGGTFNLPEGFRAMSYYDYLVGQGTHQSVAITTGDTHVNVILPNIDGLTTPQQIETIAESFARGLVSGKLSSYRHALTSAPWGYRTL